MSAPAPLLEVFRRGEASREMRLLAARAEVAPRAHEQASLLMLLAGDEDTEIRQAAEATLAAIPPEQLRAFLARADVAADVRAFFTSRGIAADDVRAAVDDQPLLDRSGLEDLDTTEPVAESVTTSAETLLQKLQKMSFTDRVKAAMRGSREARSILIRDPNKMIATSVLSSPKVSEAEIESFARMATVSEDVLRTIAMNRAWLKNYSIVLALTKNSKTPLGLSLNLLNRLNERDVTGISTDRNVPDALRIAARRRVALGKT